MRTTTKAAALAATAALAGSAYAGTAGASTAGTAQAPQTSALDQTWLNGAIQGDQFEIQGGRLALKKSKNPAVRALAQRLVTDHTKSKAEALALATKFNITVQRSPTPTQKWQLHVLQQVRGRTFDNWYSSLEVQDHTQDISEAKDETTNGFNAEVKANATKEIPILRAHRKLAQHAVKAS